MATDLIKGRSQYPKDGFEVYEVLLERGTVVQLVYFSHGTEWVEFLKDCAREALNISANCLEIWELSESGTTYGKRLCYREELEKD